MKEYLISFYYFCLCLIGRYVQSGVDDIISDDRWVLYFDKLNEAIWSGGKLREGFEKFKIEIEKVRIRKEVVQVFMDVFLGIFREFLCFFVYRVGENLIFYLFLYNFQKVVGCFKLKEFNKCKLFLEIVKKYM